MSLPFRIRRTVTIPVVHSDENILALIDVGGKVENKNWIYEQFFIHGAESVKKAILEKIKLKGGDEKTFKQMIDKASKKVMAEIAE